MDRTTIARLREIVDEHDQFVHVTHVNPDADGLGSALGMSRFLATLGKRSRVIVPTPVPRKVAFLCEPGEVEATDASDAWDPATPCFVYDVSTLRRLGGLAETVRRTTAPVVVFDHHDGVPDFDALPLIDPEAGATSQIVCDVLHSWDAVLTLRMALPLYVALVADTGSFNYGKTSPHTHHVAARLLQAGVRPLEVHGQLEGNRSPEAIRAGADVLRSLQVDAHDARLAHATMTKEQYGDGGEDAIDMLDLVNHAISLTGVRAGVLLIQPRENVVRLSMRSKGDTSVLEVARAFGGGGHRNAAGASVEGTLHDVLQDALARLRAELVRQHGPPSR